VREHGQGDLGTMTPEAFKALVDAAHRSILERPHYRIETNASEFG
jgi:uncharacterized protein (DUF736 family)